jgi:hypothetical protein
LVPQSAVGLTGVEEHGERPLGFPRNLRDPDVSTAEYFRMGRPEPTTPWPPVGASATTGNESRTQRWYRFATMKRAETGDGESERLIVP